MARVFGSLFLMLLAPHALTAQEKTLEPKGFPPSFGVAKAVTRDGKVFLEVTATTITPYTETSFQHRDGKKVQEMKTGWKRLTITERFLLDAKDAVTLGKDGKSIEQILIMNQANVYRKNGKPVPVKDIPELFTKQRAVIIFGPSEPDPYHLGVLHDDVLVITGGRNLVFPLLDEDMK